MEYIRNKKATFEYILEDTFEAGIELLGTEVKSLRARQGSISGAYVRVLGRELYLLGAHIPPWQEQNAPQDFDSYRSRKLLLHAKELSVLAKALQTKGLTVIPLSLYGRERLIKVALAIAKGKKNVDKRESLKKKALQRDLARGMRE